MTIAQAVCINPLCHSYSLRDGASEPCAQSFSPFLIIPHHLAFFYNQNNSLFFLEVHSIPASIPLQLL